MEIDNLIQGEKFTELDNCKNIFYVKTENVNNFFKNTPTNDGFILISHNSDGKITNNPKTFDADVNLIPNNLIKWYGQNVCYKHDKIISIPIGLENSMWFKEINKNGKILNKINENKKHINLLYLNFNVNTNPKERTKPFELFKNKKFVTCDMQLNGYNFDSYLNNIHNHKFVLCPEGNGTDTHRTWECLYLNTIPIEKRNINNSFYEDLPICFVNEWEDITEDFLLSEYERINKINWDLSKLDFNWWKKLINTSL